jgi:hypothetical protein
MRDIAGEENNMGNSDRKKWTIIKRYTLFINQI